MGRGSDNRPFKFGQRDRREFIVQESEVSFIAVNDVDGNPVFIGRAKVGSSVSEDKWQIRFMGYDAVQGIERGTWPQNSESNASADYEFIWNSKTDLTITAISKANPAVVTVSSLETLTNGLKIVIKSVLGMTEVNLTGSNIYTVANINVGAKTFELQGIDSSAFTAYTSSGSVIYGEAINFTYS